MSVSEEAKNFNWLLVQFVEETDGVEEAIAVSSDGLLLAASAGRDRDNVEQFAAVTSGLTSLANGAAKCFDYHSVEQLIVEMSGGFMFVSAIGDGSTLGVLADRDCDVGLIGYEMTVLLNRAGSVLSPGLVAELKNSLAA
ncbi:MAG: roadblock/LC7 domain-containing protein [Acidimicrobiia bacterium]|nr:roadblock/LC7 domain-containing protein [Acidimicrobiia bacterium]